MAVSRAEVVAIYRVALNRDTEGPQVVEQHMKAASLEALMKSIVGSQEFDCRMRGDYGGASGKQ